ncbi:cysteine hydrolase family protein [Zavarzinia compransoris]|uniref:Cysteine hydrolase n=1 Tax=Zavarzinia compransoris TaxID=1264899 RepID=A0A317E4A0_9PROT|nr:cysteine hydrolase family protein [Zavarzinia compransoris]PWR21040.1 cysteine hydrolase [Zavarzinia compransoris]TDP44073.1 nicotinamidase-related amidase [Zavarzinia compransoris]
MSKRALIVVDIQNDYFPGGRWTLDGMDQAGANAAAVIAAARAAGDKVIFIAHEFPSADAPFFAPGTEGAKLHPVVGVRADDTVIVKHAVNSFQGTNLKDVLDAAGVEDVTVIGAMSHMCIDAATRAAADFGYKVTVVHDACATRDLDFAGTVVPAASAHAAFMSALGFAYASLVSTADYVAAA